MAFHDKLARYAGGFADFITGDRFDFDGLGRGEKAENINLLEKDDDKKEEKGFLDSFLENYSYNPEKSKSRFDKFLEKMAGQGFVSGGKGSFANLGGGLSMYAPDNSARDQAIAMANAQALQPKEPSVLRKAGDALVKTGIGALVSKAIPFFGGLFCDIRLKEDIAPLQKSEVNDVLSECAFFVKDLNELS